MAVRREDSASELKDIQITQSWIPATPLKPDSTKQQSICTNWQETNVVEPNWLEAEKDTPTNMVTQANLSESRILQGDFLQEAQCQTIPACYSSSNLINASSGPNSWLNGLATDSLVYGDMLYNFDRWQEGESSTKEVDKWPNMSFASLLALAHAGCNKTALENTLRRADFMATSSVSAPSFNPQVENSHFTMSFANSSTQNLDGLLGATYQAEYNISNVLTGPTDGSSIPPRPTLDLNSLPKTVPDAAPCKITSSQLEPITPAKTNKTEHRRECSEKDSSADEAGIYEQENSQLVIDEMQLQENHKPDKGGTEETDLSKTPQQKQRRKKHRPKVIIEGTKSTPKSSAKRPSIPQDSTRVKRKYVRRKGVENNPTEERSNETGLDKNAAPDSVETPVVKRKYVRRKGVSKPEEEDMDMGTPEKTEGNPPRRLTRSSCKRSLNFNSDGQMGDDSSSCCPSSNCARELQAEKDNMGISHEPAQSTNQVREDYLAKGSTNMDLLKDDQTICTRGKCQIVFSDFTHDKVANMVQLPYRQRTPRSPIDSISSSTCLTPEKHARGLKRQNMSTTAEGEFGNRNEIGAFYNSMQAYLPVLSQVSDINNGTSTFHFPTIICKKKRSEKGHNMATSSSQFAASASDNHAKLERQDMRDSREKMFKLTTNQNGRQVFEDLLALGPHERIKKRRSKGPTRLRDLASLLEICRELPASTCGAAATSRIDQDVEIHHETPSCMEALVADTRSTLKTKKRSKRSMLINSTLQNLYNNQTSTSMGAPLALTWKSMSPIDTITEQLNRLDLNAESSQASEYQGQYALVPYQRWGAVVPFDNSFDQVRKRKPRPKVDLDDETTRVWKLLLENINSEGIDGTDEEKTKWWEEERRVFNGRADSFIARMHLVQGDRRFSPWKGSVVDSVVGVFLTQNVSDHLSSSAFMAMAARFPVKSKIHHVESDEEKLGANKEPEVCLLDPDFGLNKEILNQSVCGGDAKMLDNPEDESTKEVNSVKPSGSSSVELIQNDNLHERDTEDTFSSQTPEVSSQNSADSPLAQPTEKSDSCLLSTSEEEPKSEIKPDRGTSSNSFVKLLQMAGTVLHGVYEEECDRKISDDDQHLQSESSALNPQNGHHPEKLTFLAETIASCSKSTVSHVANSGAHATEFDLSQTNCKFFTSPSEKGICATEISDLSSESATQSTSKTIMMVGVDEGPKVSSVNTHLSNNDHIDVDQKIIGNRTDEVQAKSLLREDNYKMQEASKIPTCQQNIVDVTGSNSNIDNSRNSDNKEVNSNKIIPDYDPHKLVNEPKAKGERSKKEKEPPVDWDQLRKQARASGKQTVRTANTMDSVDWDAVRCTDVNEIAQTIKERGMNNMLAERIKDFLNRIVRDHGSIDLEWLRDVPPDKAKEYLLSIRGLGLKSVECVRLLTLHHLAFPVDTNVGRIAVRLGWVPLQPLPESLQLHLLELYPVLESIQKYLWPRLCKLDQRTLYELHYQMITFGKVFCTKSKPNCNACPMRGECRHFASAFASARLALPAPAENSIISATVDGTADQNPIRNMNTLQLPSSQANQLDAKSGARYSQPIIEEPPSPEPITEVPASPEPGSTQVPECDIETFGEDPEDIPTIQLNMEQFTHNLQNIMKQNTELQEGDMSKALVALTSEAASIPVPKLKNISRLRTEHQVYELPDSHPLLEGMDKREPDDPCPYLLAIWTPGETANSIEPPEQRCNSQGFGNLCNDETCSACNSIREANSQTVRGTLLIPCRTAMRGSFPLNGTYFQVNEVFSDHESSLSPMDIPRQWLWNLPRRTVYFGTSIPTIFKGLSTEGIQYCFWRGFVCVRGFDRITRAPRPLIARLHFPASRLGKGKGKLDEN